MLYAVCKIAKRSPQGCFTQSAGLPSAVRRVAERSRSNTAFQLPLFTFSTGPFDRLRDPRLLQHCFTQSAALLYAVRRVALRSPHCCQAQSAGLLSAVEVTLHFNHLDLHFLPDPSTGSGILGCCRIALRSLQGCQAQSAGLLSAVEVTLHFNYLDLHFLPDPSTGSGILFGLRDPRLLQHCFT